MPKDGPSAGVTITTALASVLTGRAVRRDVSMTGEITVSEDGLFYTSIPYEEGWKAVVDGKEIEITPVGGSLLAFPLLKGSHEIKLYYYPKGFWPGFAVTTICLLTFAGLCAYTYIIKKKKKATVKEK